MAEDTVTNVIDKHDKKAHLRRMAEEQDTLARFSSGPGYATQELVPKIPSLSLQCPKLAKIDPDGAARFDAAMEKWRSDFLQRLTRGANPS